MMEDLSIRPARQDECGLVLEFIEGIANYEKLSKYVTATKEGLYKALFEEKSCKVVIAFAKDIPVGFALYFYNFSTFKGKKGLYLEDLFVKEEYRHHGYGGKLFSYLAKEAKDEGCGRMEWVCLDWNESAIEFYRKLGASGLDDWTIFRLDEEDLKHF